MGGRRVGQMQVSTGWEAFAMTPEMRRRQPQAEAAERQRRRTAEDALLARRDALLQLVQPLPVLRLLVDLAGGWLEFSGWFRGTPGAQTCCDVS